MSTIDRAYYQENIPTFLRSPSDDVLGKLTTGHQFALDVLQRVAWVDQISKLKHCLQDCHAGEIFFEFAIPRMGSRADVVLLIHGVVFVIEFKVGAETYEKYAVDQVTDYAVDLKNFHEGSNDKYVVPVLISTKSDVRSITIEWSCDQVASPVLSNGLDLHQIITKVLLSLPAQQEINANEWTSSGYKPTPTIVEAAQALYRGHSVEAISRSDAGAINLTKTSRCIYEIIDASRCKGRKSIIFVTGVPGAGKTLAGLNIATQEQRGGEHAVFLSGNGPLVIVLREALARDEVLRRSTEGNPLTKKTALSQVSAFVQNIHHFRDEALRSDGPPIEDVVVYDEAQRAWNRTSAERFMTQKRGVAEFSMSEPEFLISVMDRKQDWCAIACLIGGGQEINTGEGGLIEWFDAIQKHFGHWDVYCSPHVADKSYSWGTDFAARLSALRVDQRDELHLAVSVRSYRAEKVSAFVAALLEGDSDLAHEIHESVQKTYPIVITRDLHAARRWLRIKARGSERFGLVASSGGARLKPQGVNVKAAIDPITWFLNGKGDVRSSYYLEDVATEFDIQGLELDWAGVCWDADLSRQGNEWILRSFKGTKWQHVKDPSRRMYLVNAYRVLLTRARQGMTIYVPYGDPEDLTRPPTFYDETYKFLLACGVEPI